VVSVWWTKITPPACFLEPDTSLCPWSHHSCSHIILHHYHTHAALGIMQLRPRLGWCGSLLSFSAALCSASRVLHPVASVTTTTHPCILNICSPLGFTYPRPKLSLYGSVLYFVGTNLLSSMHSCFLDLTPLLSKMLCPPHAIYSLILPLHVQWAKA